MDALFPHLPPVRPALPAGLPAGFRYYPDFLTPAAEAALLAQFAQLEFKAAQYHEYTAQRRTVGFGLGVRFGGTLADRELTLKQGPPAPEFLRALVEQVARYVGRDPRDFPHVLVTQYPPGAPIGWHRDAPPFAAIYGVSLGSDCTFCLRPCPADRPRGSGNRLHETGAELLTPAAGRPLAADAALFAGSDQPAPARKAVPRRTDVIRLTAERRSLYVMAGPARSAWQHSITPVKAQRWSITLRTLR